MESKIFYNKTNGKFYKTIECESYDVFDCRKSVGIEEVIFALVASCLFTYNIIGNNIGKETL